MEDNLSWALKLLTTLRLSPKGGFMNTIGQSGVRLAKFLDSMIQEQMCLHGSQPSKSVITKENWDCRHSRFTNFQKPGGI
jgi:hypothetical protein